MISFRPGIRNGKADALTRRSGDLPKEGDERARPVQALILSEKFQSQTVLCNTAVRSNPDIRSALTSDKLAKDIMDALQHVQKRHLKVPLGECEVKEEVLYIFGLLYVPDNEELQRDIIHLNHDHPAAGHPGRAATYELVSRNYWWPSMRKTIARYLNNCDTCARI